jgi:hypothetical protein
MNDTAMCLRQGIVQRLNECTIKLEKPWEDIIDETIYTRNGFRMVGSDKMDKKKQSENRPIDLSFVMDSNGEINEDYYERLRNNTRALITETSIRLVLDAFLDIGMDIKVPIWLEEDPLVKRRSMRGNSTQGIVVENKEHILIEKFIKEKLPKYYANTVRVMTRYPDQNILIKINSKYCMNIGRDHNSCGVYLFATPKGVYQKCLCPCNVLNGRKNGLCMNYTSECYEFNDETRKILFPEYVEKQSTTSVKKGPKKAANKVYEGKTLCDKLFEEIMKQE